MAEVEARTASYKARKELTEAQKKMTEAKTEKIALDNEGKRTMIQLYQAAQQAVERLGSGYRGRLRGNRQPETERCKIHTENKKCGISKTNGEGVENAE